MQPRLAVAKPERARRSRLVVEAAHAAANLESARIILQDRERYAGVMVEWASRTVAGHESNEDKQRAVKAALLHPNGASKSDHQIALHVGVDHTTVMRWRQRMESTGAIHQSPVRTGNDGRTINTANINIGRRPQPAAEAQPDWRPAA